MSYAVVTIGNFDGVHKGHQKIIKKVVSIAKRKNGTAVLYTFDPHPVSVLAPDLTPEILLTKAQKIELLKELGIDKVIIRPFTKKLAEHTAEDFFKKILIKEIGAKEIVVGYDFTFGLHRSGTTEYLKELGKKYGIKIHIIDAVFQKESLISSTHIRHFIGMGRVESAAEMLGRQYCITGRVVKGQGIGAELGFRTANIDPINMMIPPTGVYITMAKVGATGKWLWSATNIGYNPTFGGTKLVIETHILDFNGNIRGKGIAVKFFKKIRREMTFESMDALRSQIRRDIKVVKKYRG